MVRGVGPVSHPVPGGESHRPRVPRRRKCAAWVLGGRYLWTGGKSKEREESNFSSSGLSRRPWSPLALLSSSMLYSSHVPWEPARDVSPAADSFQSKSNFSAPRKTPSPDVVHHLLVEDAAQALARLAGVAFRYSLRSLCGAGSVHAGSSQEGAAVPVLASGARKEKEEQTFR